MQREVYDVIVVGSGAGGLATAVTAAALGLRTIVLEKEAVIGGTTAFSGGYLWVPGHPKGDVCQNASEIADARMYLAHEAGNSFDTRRIDEFLSNTRKMVEFFERKTDVQFLDAPAFSDYHPDAPGGKAGGRSILAAPLDGNSLGDDIGILRPPLSTITFVGMMFNSSQEVNHFFNVTRSVKSAWHVTKRLAAHARDLALHRRGMRLTSGNALVARLLLSARRFDVSVNTLSPVKRLIHDDTKVLGVEIESSQGSRVIEARRGVVLACGGFPQDVELRKRLFAHARTGLEHVSPAPAGNTGDGLRMAEGIGAKIVDELPNAAAWIPVSKVPSRRGEKVFPHLIDRYKPGVIAVSVDGRRFVNEANSYHDFGQAMIKAADGGECVAWLICDHRALRKYGLGFVKPFPVPYSHHIRSGYLVKGRTPRDLAQRAGFDPDAFEKQIAEFNSHAAEGRDHAFGKGDTAYNRFLGDANQTPNPCVAPLSTAPFYAIQLALGDLGTFAGLSTDQHGRVLNTSGEPISGLFAAGNDASSIMGGAYPGGGITLGPAMTFGFVTGAYIADRKNT